MATRGRERVRLLARLIVVVALGGCGYGFGGRGTTIPAEARTIAIRVFTNQTREEGLELALKQALDDEFRRRGALALAGPGESDLVLIGTIRRFVRVPVAATGFDQAVQFQGVLQVSVRLVERASERVIYRNASLQESQDFEGTSGLVIDASPRFQRHTMDVRDVANLTNVELGESQRRQAMADLVDVMARSIYVHAMEGF